MQSKSEFLKKFLGNAKITNITEVNICELPNEWIEIFNEYNLIKRKNKIINMWSEDFSKKLGKTITYLNKNIREIDLIERNGKYSILYGIIKENGEIQYYQGGNPKDNNCISKLKEDWGKMPKSIVRFYENLHNGFNDCISHAMGLERKEEVTFFDDYHWGIIEDLEEPIKINLKTTYGFFRNGGGGYVAFDCSSNRYVVWFANDQPEYDIDFWDVVDEWILMGLEG